MSTAPVVPQAPNLFRTKGIADIGMIDDAFDPLQVDSLVDADIGSFLAALEQEEQLQTALRAAGIEVEKRADLNDDVLRQLWAQRNVIAGLETLLKVLLRRKSEIIADAEEIRSNIEALQLRVQEAGTTSDLSDEGRCKIILLDYYLGDEGQAAIDASVAKAVEIHNRSKDRGEYPVFVLMSSAPLSPPQVEQFRKSSELIGGIFHHIPKTDLKNKETLERKLMAIAMSLPIAPSMVSLIEAVERALTSSRKLLSDKMRDLSLEDYAYIDRLALKEDGQPFGEYILWLFGGELHKLVFESDEVRAKCSDVDKTTFPNLPVKQLVPSKNLASMFRSAQFQDLPAEIPVHPLGDKENEHLLISLGDIFLNQQNSLWMVLNPECDLAYSPKSKGRHFSKDKSVVLLPGSLQLLTESPSVEDENRLRTELFVHNNTEYRIIWDPKRVMTKPYGELKAWLEVEGYLRMYRLRLMYALQAQQRFIADFGRVGPPIAPPIFMPAIVEVFSFDQQSKYRTMVAPSDSLAALVNVKGRRSCLFDLSFLEALLASADEANTVLDAKIKLLTDKGEEAKANASSGGRPEPTAELEKLNERLGKFTGHKKLLEAFLGDREAQLNLISVAHSVDENSPSKSLAGFEGLFDLEFGRELKGQYSSKSLFTISVGVKRDEPAAIDTK
jgi:hypothetical protein